MENHKMSSIEPALVDEVVLGAMSLLVEDATCKVSDRAPGQPDDITVAVYCDGDQQSAVVLRCSQAFARHLTGRMLELEPEEIAPADILDATGELVNVIAGNLRGLVPSPGKMTAPFPLDLDLEAQLCHGAVNTYTVTGEPMQIFRM